MRDLQLISPPLGKAFDFTTDEKADLDRIHAEHGVESYREPVNEVPVEAVKSAEEVKSMTAAEKKAAEKEAAAKDAAAKLAAAKLAAVKLVGETGNAEL